MAQVWEGHDEVLARPVAVKLLHEHLAADADVRERFRREAIAAARLAHPNVVAIFDTGVEDDLPFIVMELVTGQTLRERLNDGPIPAGLAVAITDQAAQALASAHGAGLVHRDVKPGNILLIDDGPVPHVKVTDFGIARATIDDARLANTDLTDPGTVMGTMKYIAPEVVEGHAADGRSDVYGLGVVLFEMLTGRVPFEACTPLATAIARLNEDPPRPRQLRAGVPRSLEQVTLKALARDPSDRYASAEELRAALLAIDLGPDDAIPLVQADPTPARGAAPAAFHTSERSWIVPTVLIILAAAVLITAGVLFASSDTGQNLFDAAGGGTAKELPVVGVRSFDPGGDGQENEAQVGAATDPDPATTWSSDTYQSPAPRFGNLKDGLGLVIELGGDQALAELQVVSPSQGWSAQVYVSDQAATALAGWGTPVEDHSNIGGDVTFDLGGSRGRYVLLWFTRLPADGRIEVGDLRIRG